LAIAKAYFIAATIVNKYVIKYMLLLIYKYLYEKLVYDYGD